MAGWTSALSAEGRDSPAQGFPKHSHCTLLHWHCKLQIAHWHCTLTLHVAHCTLTLHISHCTLPVHWKIVTQTLLLVHIVIGIVIGTYCYWNLYCLAEVAPINWNIIPSVGKFANAVGAQIGQLEQLVKWACWIALMFELANLLARWPSIALVMLELSNVPDCQGAKNCSDKNWTMYCLVP